MPEVTGIVAVTHCTGCGRPAPDCPTGGVCTTAFEPPRHCPECGRRLAVRISPTAWVAKCRDHGELPAGTTGGGRSARAEQGRGAGGRSGGVLPAAEAIGAETEED